MAWPPPVLATTRTDTTVMATTHPADHNAANLAINDLVARVKRNEPTMYQVALAANYTVTASATTILTIPMPAAPAGTVLDIFAVLYTNQTVVGTAGTFATIGLNGVNQTPAIIIPDIVATATWGCRSVKLIPPVGATYNVTLFMNKGAGGGTIAAQATNSVLGVISYGVT